ncbi:unnamed protein product, partial [Choristocarpus tenellus]
LRSLILRGNRFTRVGVHGSSAQGGSGIVDGLAALTGLIGVLPELRLLDVSGCSHLPHGPTARLYSFGLSERLSFAIANGLSTRISTASRKCDRDLGRKGSERAQVDVVRMGGNHFSSAAWQQLLLPLSLEPPLELDFTCATVLGGGQGVQTRCDISGLGSRIPAVECGAGEAAVVGGGVAVGSGWPQGEGVCTLLTKAVLPEGDVPGLGRLLASGTVGFFPGGATAGMGVGQCMEGNGESLIGTVSEAPNLFGSERGRAQENCVVKLFLDPLLSPLCRLTALHLGDTITTATPLARPGRGTGQGVGMEIEAGGLLERGCLGPADLRGLCEAAAGCASLQQLDLSGGDLSGPQGAEAVAAGVRSVISRGRDEGGVLNWLGLSNCCLGLEGLARVLESLSLAAGDGSG